MPIAPTSIASATRALSIVASDPEHTLMLRLAPQPDGTFHLVLTCSLAERDASNVLQQQRAWGAVDLDDPAALAAAGITSADVDALKRVLLGAGGFVAAQNGFAVTQ